MATTAPKSVAKTGPQAVPSEPSADDKASPTGKSKTKKILGIGIVILLLGGGIATWAMMGQSKPSTAADKAAAKHVPVKPPVFLPIEQFTINLQPDGVGEQFLQVAFTLQVADQEQADLIKLYMPQARSRLLLLLSSKKASEISTADGKKKLLEEIMAQVKQPFNAQSPPQGISNVFFTSFVIQ